MDAFGQFTFDGFRCDSRTGQLWRDAREINLTPRTAAVLHALAAHAQALVTKNDLFERVWGRIAVTDDALTSCVQELRRALGDDARHPRYIETRHRRGYRLMVPVVPVVDPTDAAEITRGPMLSQAMSGPLLGVFPLQVLPCDEDLNALASYVTLEIAHGLWRSRVCDVIVVGDSAPNDGGPSQLRYTLRGSLLRLENGLLLSVRCEAARRGAAIWFARFGPEQFTTGRLNAWLSRATSAVQLAIQVAELARAKVANDSDDPETHSMLSEAHALAGELEPDANLRALVLLRTILGQAPDEPRALALAAWCHAQRCVYNWSADADGDRCDVERFAASATRLGANDPNCLTMVGTARSLIGDHMGAVPLLDRALQLNPHSSWTQSRLGWLATYLDRPDRAIRHFRIALGLTPLDPAIFNSMIGLGNSYFVKGQFTPAINWMERGLALNPRATWIYRTLVPAYMAVGKRADAERGIGTILKEYPSLSVASVCNAMVFSRPTMARFADGLLQGGLPPA